MDVDTEKLTPEQREDWEYYLTWYQSNGWTGDEAIGLAWKDFSRKYPDVHHP